MRWCDFSSTSLHFEGERIFTVHIYIIFSSFLQNPGFMDILSLLFLWTVHPCKQSLRLCLLQGMYCSRGRMWVNIHGLDQGMCREGREWISINSDFSHYSHMQRFEEKPPKMVMFSLFSLFFFVINVIIYIIIPFIFIIFSS